MNWLQFILELIGAIAPVINTHLPNATPAEKTGVLTSAVGAAGSAASSVTSK